MATPIQQFEGKYEILEKIAEGGMGALYKVRHRLLDEVRVIKVMRPQLEQQEGIKARFLREARLASKMRQANIAQLYDFSMDESANAFIVMEFIDGVTLQQMLQRSGPSSTALTLEMAKQSLLALEYLHRKKVVHRDISPDNFMITSDEMGDPLIKLIDLGIAKALQADAGLTATGMFVGKIRYASPEHFKPDEGTQVDQRSDLYSFGVVLYELLTGTHPIEGSNFSTLIAGHLFRPPVDFKVSDPGGRVPDELREIVLRALAKAPSDRYPNARTFRDDIATMQHQFPVDDAVLEEVGRIRQLARTGRPVSRPGSTQERINAEFQGATPAPSQEVSNVQMTEALSPSEAEAGVVPFAPAGTEQEKHVEALLSAAERLIHADLLAESRVQLQAVLRIDDGNERARTLLERVEEKERHAEAIARAVADVESRLESGQPGQAADRLEQAVAELGETEALLELRRKVDEAQEAERAEKAAALATEAQALLGDDRYDEAVARLQEAVRLRPEQADLLAQLATATAAMRRHEGDQRRAQTLANAEREVAGHLEEGRLEEARNAVEQAADRLGDSEEIDSLRERVAAAEKERREERVAALLVEAAEMQQADDLQGAAARLDEALELDPECSQAQSQREQVREAVDRTTKRETQLEDELGRIGALLEDERFDEARSALQSLHEELAIWPDRMRLAHVQPKRTPPARAPGRRGGCPAWSAPHRVFLRMDGTRRPSRASRRRWSWIRGMPGCRRSSTTLGMRWSVTGSTSRWPKRFGRKSPGAVVNVLVAL